MRCIGFERTIVVVAAVVFWGAGQAESRHQLGKPVAMFESETKTGRYLSKSVAQQLQRRRWVPAIVVLKLDGPNQKPADLVYHRERIAKLQRQVLAGLEPTDFRLTQRYTYVAGFAGQLSARGLRRLSHHPDVLGIDFDHEGVGHLAESVLTIGADQWHVEGVTGQGTLVAVLDTGVANHQDLDDDVQVELCLLASNTANGGMPCPNGTGQQLFEPDAALDGQGHGTNVTGIITSSGTLAPRGVAPDAEIVAIKVLDDQDPAGTGQISDWIKGLDWVLTIHPAVDGIHDVNVVSMSLGMANQAFIGNGDCEQPGTSGQLMADAVNILRDVGVLTVASSGNDGFGNGLSFPACVSSIVSVGASDDDDQIMFFTNSNANLDLLAPGNQITSTGISDTGILTQSGTSQASPHVAACAALRVQDNPTLNPDQLQLILTNSPVSIANPANGLSFPRLWCQPPVDL